MQRTLERADAIVRALERERRLGRSLIAASLLLITLARTTHAMAPAETPNTIFFHANALYGEERWAEAAAEYERVLAAGWESGNLYFNLGNAWFRAGDVGRAVLDYERARRLLPRDPDVQANLSYAREQAGESGTETLWPRLVFPLAGRAASDELLGAASALYAAIMALLTVALFVPAVAPGARSAAARSGRDGTARRQAGTRSPDTGVGCTSRRRARRRRPAHRCRVRARVAVRFKRVCCFHDRCNQKS